MKFKIALPHEWEKYKDGILFTEQRVFSDDVIAQDEGIIIGNTYGSPIEDEAHFSLKLNRKFGAKVIKTLENWFDSGETYYQYYIRL